MCCVCVCLRVQEPTRTGVCLRLWTLDGSSWGSSPKKCWRESLRTPWLSSTPENPNISYTHAHTPIHTLHFLSSNPAKVSLCIYSVVLWRCNHADACCFHLTLRVNHPGINRRKRNGLLEVCLQSKCQELPVENNMYTKCVSRKWLGHNS